MTKAEIVQEIVDRGYNYVKPARIGKFVDRWHKRICDMKPWPFLEETKKGAAPLEIADLDKVLSVKTTGANQGELRGTTRERLVYRYGDLTETGTPEFWYLEDRTLKTFPVSEATEVDVRYKKRVADLADDDEPLFDDDWHDLLVDGGVSDCLKDDDEYEEARSLKAEVLETVRTEMVHTYLRRNLQDSRTIRRTGRAGDYQ